MHPAFNLAPLLLSCGVAWAVLDAMRDQWATEPPPHAGALAMGGTLVAFALSAAAIAAWPIVTWLQEISA